MKPVNAEIFPAPSACAPSKPIVTTRTFPGSPPAFRTSVSNTAVSDGTPVIPTVLPSSAAGERASALAGGAGGEDGGDYGCAVGHGGVGPVSYTHLRAHETG